MPSPRPSGSNDHDDGTTPIPDLARAWESYSHVASSVRRPSTLPDPDSYHELIETDAIFELDEKQKDGSKQTLLVVPFGCERCRSLKQACSRGQPACARCRNAGARCELLDESYQRLPGPKVPRGARRQLESSEAAHGGRSCRVASGSKRPLSPVSDAVPPRKKTQVKKDARKKKARRSTAEDMDVEDLGPAQGASTDVPSALKWSFVYQKRSFQGQEGRPSDNTLVPRVWTNSLGTLFTVFPELGKSTIGFSWFQSETPILLLDTNYARGHWTSSTTVNIELLWDFSCYEHELESDPQSDAEDSARPRSSQPAVQSPSTTLEPKAEKMDSPTLYSTPGSGSFPTTYVTVPAPIPTLHTQMLPSNGIPPDACQGSCSWAGGGSLDHPAAETGFASGEPLTQPSPSSLSSPLSSLSSESQPEFESCIPFNKPPEVETLLDSHLRFIPLLLWMSHDSGLVPRNLSPEYAYSCLGLFFVSDLSHASVLYDVSSTPGRVHGQVCWSVTLEWAPGGEDALFDCNSSPSSNIASGSTQVDPARDLLHPWWYEPTDTSSQTEEAISYRPRDLRLQFFSFIPLDFLAEFHPSESFPRGWFCKSCGLINPQLFFRHQICQSTRCRSMRDKRIPPGKIDPLSRLRDPYQCSALIRPTNGIPTAVVSDCVTWDDGMQSWNYQVKERVLLCHVFTRNEKCLQEDATTLLEKIQCEVLLFQEDPDSPYFFHRTRLSHPSDGSEAMVPVGTPHCVRTAYYTLCDFVYRYGEMVKPRFGELRIQAWVTTGSKKGNLFRASTSPVVIHCLGAEVGLNLTPKGGYRDAAKSIAPDKGKGRAMDDDREGSPPTVPRTEHPHRPTSSMSGLEANKPPSVAENADEGVAAMDTMPHSSNQVATGIAMPDSNAGPEMEVVNHERRGRKQNKGTKDKNKASVPEICMTLVHGDCVVLFGDDFECQIVRTGTTILVIGFPEER